MKKLWWAVVVLALLLSATLWNSHCVAAVTDDLAAQLSRACELAESGDWKTAEKITRAAQEQWEDATGYLYTVLPHSSTDAVEVGFHEVLEFLTCQESGEYSAANAVLIAHIRLLSDMERLTPRNLL
ncbi:MAG: DUF4363 family protein [Oscillospiraceae bacterium]|nr:DUF4363 family protein [Oscillospiraceae bacterium]